MFKRTTPQPGEKHPAGSTSLLTRMTDRYGHLYIDIGLCIGLLVVIVGMIAAARALDDWLPLI
jgi:hypothetical protein